MEVRPTLQPLQTLQTLQTLRLPKGLWADVEATVIKHDRQFLTEVARSLSLPVSDVLRRCLGTGANQPVAMIHSEDPSACPWWDCTNGLWSPCSHLRLTPTTPCERHRRPAGSVLTSGTKGIPEATPVSYDGEIYWVTPDQVWAEDGTDSPHRFKFVHHRGQRICVKT